MAAQAVKALPEGDEWLYEVKWDGIGHCLSRTGERCGSGHETTRT
jgi:ATP-dependent DNA ligase